MTVALNTTRPATVPSQADIPGCIADRDLLVSKRSVVTALALVIAGFLPSYVSAQHVHGVIDLGVVIEENTLAVSIDAPLSDVVGFEHAPATEEQASMLANAAAIIASGDAMFGVPESAACSVSSTEIAAPDFLEALIVGEDDAEADHDHHDHDSHDHDSHGHEDHDSHDHESHGHEDHDSHDHDSHGHEDHESHDHGDKNHGSHDHDGDHDHDHSTEHSEVNATYQWTCRNPSELDALALSFIEGFASVETIRVQLLTSDGAQVMNLTGNDTSLPLARR